MKNHNEDSKSLSFLLKLEQVIKERKKDLKEGSYTSKLFKKGMNKIAQKVGEEAVELIIEAKDHDNSELFLDEAADLLYHYMVLLEAKGEELASVVKILEKRHK